MKQIQSIGKRLRSAKKDVQQSAKSNKLLQLNDLISHPLVTKGICASIFLFSFLLLYFAFRQILTLLHYSGDSNFLKLNLLTGIVSLIISIMTYYRITVYFRDYNVGQKGDAAFMTVEEIIKAFPGVPLKDLPFPGRGGIPVFRIGDLVYIDARANNNYIIAITRGGKGQAYVLPSIDLYSRAEIQSSLVINDIKGGELSRASINTLLKRGYRIRMLDLLHPERSHGYNFLSMAIRYYKQGKKDWAQDLCSTFAYSLYAGSNGRDKFWEDAPTDLVAAVALAQVIDCIKLGTEDRVNSFSVAFLIGELESIKDEDSKESALDQYFTQRDRFDPAKLLYMTIKFSEGKTRSSVLSVAYSKLKIFLLESSSKVFTKDEIDLEQIGFDTEKPTALFIRLPYNNKSLSAVTSIFIGQLYQALTNRAGEDEYKGKCIRPVKIIGDEIFNGPPIAGIESMLAMGLSADISLDLYAQSDEQPELVYDKTASVIKDNCSTQVFLMARSSKTKEEFSKSLGPRTQKNITRTGSRFALKKTLTESYEERPLLSVDQLGRLKEGEAVIHQTTKRRDLKGNRIVSNPIFIQGDANRLFYQYEYLPEFDPDQEIPYEKLRFTPTVTDLSTLIYLPDLNELGETAVDPKQRSVQELISPQRILLIENKLNSLGFATDLSQFTLGDFEDYLEDLHAQGYLAVIDYQIIRNQLETG